MCWQSTTCNFPSVELSYGAFLGKMKMALLHRMKVFGLVAGPAMLLVFLDAPALAQTVTIDAFIDADGKKIPSICLISNAPPKDLCGPILQGFSAAQFQILRGIVEQQIEQKSRILLQQQNR
jgi:hypothetical protein